MFVISSAADRQARTADRQAGTADRHSMMSGLVSSVQALQVFESHAGILGPGEFKEFSLPYLRDIARRVKEKLKEAGQDVPMVRDLNASIVCVCVVRARVCARICPLSCSTPCPCCLGAPPITSPGCSWT